MSCVQCGEHDRTNQHRLNPLLFPITYETAEIITSLGSQRKYTSTHNDVTREIYLNIGTKYDKRLLDSEEVIKDQTQIVGKWVVKDNKHEIHLKVLVNTEKNPQAQIRNEIFCRELGVVLEGIALAETGLLKIHQGLASTKIFIHFRSIDPKYNRVEYWHRLGYWTQDSIKDKSESHRGQKERPKNEDELYSDKKKKKRHHNRPRPSCQMCQSKG